MKTTPARRANFLGSFSSTIFPQFAPYLENAPESFIFHFYIAVLVLTLNDGRLRPWAESDFASDVHLFVRFGSGRSHLQSLHAIGNRCKINNQEHPDPRKAKGGGP